jgi:inorganic triphosphatase YgiF
MAQETELKLLMQARDVPRLLAHPLLAASPAQRQRLRNTYFDTPTLALMARRIAVRERRVGSRTLLTVKTAGHSVAGLSQRGEWEGPTQPGRMDFAALVDEPSLAAELDALKQQLVPVFRTDFTRRSWRVDGGQGLIEVALDQGTIITGGPNPAAGEARREAILELELELLSGPVDALQALALSLARSPDGPLWLLPSDRSKAERGLALFLGQPLAPRKAQRVALQATMHPLDAYRAITHEALAQLQANLAGFLRPHAAGVLPDPDFIHQARVALRRLRSGLGLFRAHLPADFVADWRARWKDMAATLDDARNWDVLDERLMRWLTDRAVRGVEPDPFAGLAQWVLLQRRAAHQRAARALRQPAHALDVLRCAQALQALPAGAPAAGRQRLARWAATALRQRHRRLRQQTRHAHRLDIDGLHALRIRLKKLRYAEADLQSVLPTTAALREPVLAQAQDLLGELNDLATAQRLMRACDVPGVDAWHRHLRQRRARILLALPTLQRTLRKLWLP